ncbi:hypothetical protein [Streptomyces sp. NPDC000351]
MIEAETGLALEEGFGFGISDEAADGVRAVRDVIDVVRDRTG